MKATCAGAARLRFDKLLSRQSASAEQRRFFGKAHRSGVSNSQRRAPSFH